MGLARDESIRGGDEHHGFEVSFDKEIARIHVRVWGFWNADVAGHLVQTLPAVRAHGRAESLLLDARGLKAQRDEGQRALGDLFALFSELGVIQASIACDSPLAKMQLMRLVKERAPEIHSH